MASSSAKPEPDPALKAKLASLVSRLTAELGVGGGRSAEGLATASVAMLSKMISPYDVTKVSVQQSQKALAACAPDPEAFAAHYARLKAMRVREVDKYLAVVAKIAGDPDLLAAVTAPRPSEARAAASPSTYAMSENAAVSEVTNADVSSLPVDGISFQTNPLASEAESPGGDASDETRARGMRRLGDDFAEERDARDVAETRARVRALDIVTDAEADDDDAPRRALLEGVDFPRLPEWTRRRARLAGARLGGADGSSLSRASPGKPLREYSAACQELLVVDDLLYAMLGVDGRFVAARRKHTNSFANARNDQGATNDVEFVIEPGLEGSLHALARQALPLCASAAAVASFCEDASVSFAGGLTRHALAAEMEEMLQDWHVMVVQLEHQRNTGRLSLQSLWFYARPAAGALATLAATARKVSEHDLRGADLLNTLHADASARAGDPSARSLTLRLLAAASRPYVRAVERWVYEGVVDDPYDEFLVVERKELRKESLADEYNAKYWERRYSLRAETPRFLSGALASMALVTGKYIDAARESRRPARRARGGEAGESAERVSASKIAALSTADGNGDFVLPPRPEDGLGRVALDAFATGREGGEMAARIERAFKHASAGLLRAVLDDGDLRARLRSLKKYFLLHQGDFLVHFVDIAGAELARPAPDVSVERLQSMLELSLKVEGSAAASDPHADRVTCALERRGIFAQLLAIQGAAGAAGPGPRGDDPDEFEARARDATSLEDESLAASSSLTGMDTFTLEYRAPWPTSLVLSRKALTKYQLLFRHVFHCKHVERRLCAAWRARKATRGGGGSFLFAAGGALGRAHVVLQRMLHFTQNFVHYLTMEVIDPNWAAFERSLDEASTVDELIAAHDAFLDACLKEGMLFWPTTLRRLDVIAKTCVAFADAVASLDDEDDAGVSVVNQAVAGEDGDLARRLESLESSFDECVKELFVTLNRSAHTEPNLSSLCARLDFNEYYTYGPGGKYA